MTGPIAARISVTGTGSLARRLGPLVEAAQDCLDRNVVGDGSTGGTYLRAGGGYPDPWTRDAAINAWQAGAWLLPAVTERTLRRVCEPDGSRVVWDDQWWDQVVWLLGARERALVAGDRAFAGWAADVGRATLRVLDGHCFDPVSGLYLGPAVMADGITGYPPRLHDPARPADSFVLDHAATHTVAALSTNALYVLALSALADLCDLTGVASRPWRERSDRLAERIRTHFRLPDGRFGYLRVDGQVTGEQEGLGLALAVLAGVTTPDEGRSIVRAAHREPFGLPAVWPAFAGIPAGRFARHGTALWPMIMGMWAQAVARTGDAATFGRELDALCGLVEGSDLQFLEVYSPATGEPDGGWQAGRDWRSEADQTWSATTFLGTVLHGLAGLRPVADGLELRPCLPPGAGRLELRGVPWRGSTFDLVLRGAGTRIGRVVVDGSPQSPPADTRADPAERPPAVLRTIPRTVDVTCHEEEPHP